MTRRQNLGVLMAAGASPASRPSGNITDVAGVKVGHWTSRERPTGCTVILTEAGAVGGVDVRGGAPGTRETDLLNPLNSVEKVHAVALSGGSAFGLATADGVMRHLASRKIGFPVGRAVVPIVPAAILFDLGMGSPEIWPDAAAGAAAAKAARSGKIDLGSVGAGAGATIGKLRGPRRAMKGGIGSASLRLDDGLVVGAIVAVNAIGDVVDPADGRPLAGLRTPDGKALASTTAEMLGAGSSSGVAAGEATTIGVVAVNRTWTKAQATKVAQMAHDGLARAIRPVHLPMDGDTLFALGSGDTAIAGGEISRVGVAAAEAVALAVVSAILEATAVLSYPAHRDLK